MHYKCILNSSAQRREIKKNTKIFPYHRVETAKTKQKKNRQLSAGIYIIIHMRALRIAVCPLSTLPHNNTDTNIEHDHQHQTITINLTARSSAAAAATIEIRLIEQITLPHKTAERDWNISF